MGGCKPQRGYLENIFWVATSIKPTKLSNQLNSKYFQLNYVLLNSRVGVKTRVTKLASWVSIREERSAPGAHTCGLVCAVVSNSWFLLLMNHSCAKCDMCPCLVSGGLFQESRCLVYQCTRSVSYYNSLRK